MPPPDPTLPANMPAIDPPHRAAPSLRRALALVRLMGYGTILIVLLVAGLILVTPHSLRHPLD